jgi:hypothetical protein
MTDTQRSRIQSLLAAQASPFRNELLVMGFDAIVAQPLSNLVGHADLANLIVQGMDRAHVETITRRHVLPAVTRVQQRLGASNEKVRDFLSPDAEKALRALVASGKGPRFSWLNGAIDPADLQKLITPIVQQVLTSFVTKLPIPGLTSNGRTTGSGSSRPPGNATGLVGMIGKQVAQVAKGASQLAGGLGLQQVVRDFSQSAAVEIRGAIIDRLKSDEGREIMRRVRDRVLDRILDTKASRIVDDFLRVSPTEVARVAEGAVSHTRELTLFRDIVAGEIQATLTELGARSLREVLEEARLLEPVRAVAVATIDPALADLARSEAFGGWLDRLLAQSADPGVPSVP